MPATTLEGRLCCASACTYAVLAGESTLDPQAANPYYAGVGFKEPPTVFQAGDQEINACLVGFAVPYRWTAHSLWRNCSTG
jgi:hypothetical protein